MSSIVDYQLSHIVIKKTLDADFQTIMEDAKFSHTPREVITPKQMMLYHARLELTGGDIYEQEES